MNIEQELKAVEILGDRIGYGNMMELASIIWGIKQEKTHGTSDGVFIPALRQHIHKNILLKLMKERDHTISVAKIIINNSH